MLWIPAPTHAVHDDGCLAFAFVLGTYIAMHFFFFYDSISLEPCVVTIKLALAARIRGCRVGQNRVAKLSADLEDWGLLKLTNC